MNLSQIMNSLQSIAAVMAPLVATALWQGIAIAVGLALSLRFIPRISASLRFALWTTGFAVLAVLPFLPQLSGMARGGMPLGGPGAAEPWLQVDIRWSLAVAGLWIAASLIRAADLAIHSFRLRRLWKTAIPVELCGGIALPARTWGRKVAQVCTTQALDRPSVIGFFAPRILIPKWLYGRLTAAELDQIVLHEVEHLRRGDDWTNLVQKLCLVLFPLNPALWWIERQLCKEREMACDEGVIAITREPRAYAACLTSLAERGLQRKAEALSLGAWQRRPELVHRVHSILRRSSALGPFASGALLSALGGSLLVVSLEFARCPQFVAFVPSQKIALAANHLQSEGAASVDVVYRPEARRLDASSFHAVEAKAVMATAAKVSPRVERTEIHRKPLKPSAALHAQEADAKLTATQATPDAGQQWIVLTSWEQVETSSAPAERAPGSAQSAVSEASSEPDRQVTSRITVTQLVFRVVSSASKSSQPKAMPFRDGWFVIQL